MDAMATGLLLKVVVVDEVATEARVSGYYLDFRL
jgi:hypothetical protein